MSVILLTRVGRTYVVTVGIDSHTPWCPSVDIMVKNRHDLLTDRQGKKGEEKERETGFSYFIQ